MQELKGNYHLLIFREVTLREAILELKNWCDTAEFELSELKSNNRSTPLIKEWKDVVFLNLKSLANDKSF